MRSPAVAGAFYERSREALLRQIRECYTHPLGPGRVPQVQRAERRIVGLVVPHAGYAYSGPIAAHSYAALAADGWPSSFVILGPNHHGAGAPLAITNHEWQTPLGSVAADEDLYHRLSKPPLEDDIRAHRDEHSIEVQLPFLQVGLGDVAVLPLVVGVVPPDAVVRVLDHVWEDPATVVVLSTDLSHFTHVGAQYNQLPTRGLTAPAFAKDQDAKAIEKILALDAQAFAGKVTQAEISMCGYGPVTAMLTAAKQLGAKGATLLKYGTSSDVSHDAHMAVGYGAIAVYR